MITIREFMKRYNKIKDRIHIVGIKCVDDIIELDDSDDVDNILGNMNILRLDRVGDNGLDRYKYVIVCNCIKKDQGPRLRDILVFDNFDNCRVRILSNLTTIVEFNEARPIARMTYPDKSSPINFHFSFDPATKMIYIDVDLLSIEKEEKI